MSLGELTRRRHAHRLLVPGAHGMAALARWDSLELGDADAAVIPAHDLAERGAQREKAQLVWPTTHAPVGANDSPVYAVRLAATRGATNKKQGEKNPAHITQSMLGGAS